MLFKKVSEDVLINVKLAKNVGGSTVLQADIRVPKDFTEKEIIEHAVFHKWWPADESCEVSIENFGFTRQGATLLDLGVAAHSTLVLSPARPEHSRLIKIRFLIQSVDAKIVNVEMDLPDTSTKKDIFEKLASYGTLKEGKEPTVFLECKGDLKPDVTLLKAGVRVDDGFIIRLFV